jgi:diacylglycerol kinase (ATP)
MSLRWSQRALSFRHAIRGILLVARTQPNAWIHAVATILVIGAGLLLGVSHAEWIALVFAIGLVWTAEALNTAIEFLADEVSEEERRRIGHAKDAGAAGVLLASITSAIVGLIVFVPHVLVLWLLR